MQSKTKKPKLKQVEPNTARGESFSLKNIHAIIPAKTGSIDKMTAARVGVENF